MYMYMYLYSVSVELVNILRLNICFVSSTASNLDSSAQVPDLAVSTKSRNDEEEDEPDLGMSTDSRNDEEDDKAESTAMKDEPKKKPETIREMLCEVSQTLDPRVPLSFL